MEKNTRSWTSWVTIKSRRRLQHTNLRINNEKNYRAYLSRCNWPTGLFRSVACASSARPRRPNRHRFVRNPNAVVDILVTDESHFELRNAFGFPYIRPHFARSLSAERKTLENNQKRQTLQLTTAKDMCKYFYSQASKKKITHYCVCGIRVFDGRSCWRRPLNRKFKDSEVRR